LVEACDEAVAKVEGVQFTYVFVNDGSRDKSLAVLEKLQRRRPDDVLVVDLSRNFGKEIALSAGVDHADGDAVIFLDADLQHPPSLIPELVAKWREGNEVVVAVRKSTEKKTLFRHLSSGMFQSFLARFSDHEVVPGATDFRIIDRCVVLALREITERQRMFRGLIDWLGFRRALLEFEAGARYEGVPSYSTAKLIQLAIDGFLSHSEAPLRFVFFGGAFTVLASAFGLLWMTFAIRFVGKEWFYTPLAKAVVANTGIMGVLLLAMGTVGLYVAKIHREVKGRPLYAVRKRLGARSGHTTRGDA
jgi:dolichol-phosphate mannosyltransferase